MRTFVLRSVAHGAMCAGLVGMGAVGFGPAGCSSDVSGPSSQVPETNDKAGSIGMQLTLPGGEQLSSVSWTITGPNGGSTVVQTGTVNVGNSQTVSFQIGGIAPGSGYAISLTGTTTDGLATCAGSASFSIAARATTSVAVTLQCNTAAPEAGAALISGNTFNCGTVTSISASPAEITVGYPVSLSSSATGPNPGQLTYSWAAPSGSFDNANVANPHFTCAASGAVTLTLTVSDGTVPDGGTCNTTLSTSTVSVQCDNGPLQSDVQNVVIIYAENRTFDSLFGNFPGAHGLSEVVDSSGNPTLAYVPQKDRDGTVLSKLPETWLTGATASGNPTVIAPAMTDNMPNAPFPLETGFGLHNPGAANLTTTDVTRDMAHRFFENQMEINGGTNDMFAAWVDAGGITMGHFDYSHSALYAIAQQSVVADNFFEGAFGGSFLNHQYLICGCAPTVPASFITSNNPSFNTLGTANSKGVPQLAANSSQPASALTGPPNLKTGNIAPLDYFGVGDGYRAVNTMQPAYQPSGNQPAVGATDLRYASSTTGTSLPPQTQTTIGDLLTTRGIGWVWYAGAWTQAVADGTQANGVARTVIYTPSSPRGNPDFQAHHHPFNYYASMDPATQATARAAHLKDYTDLVSDASAGTLPPVAFYKPTGYQNMHPGYANIDDADAHIASVITALKASPQWSHMVVLVTFDEYGGQWDHVAPPKADLIGPGSRVPAIIISPYAKTGTVDHTQYDTASFLRLVTHRYGLPTLQGLSARDTALVANGGTPMGDLTNALTLP